MTIQGLCIPCQHGMHEEHHDVPDPGVDGLIGSRWECPCRGGCVDQYAARNEAIVRVVTPEEESEWRNIDEFLARVEQAQNDRGESR